MNLSGPRGPALPMENDPPWIQNKTGNLENLVSCGIMRLSLYYISFNKEFFILSNLRSVDVQRKAIFVTKRSWTHLGTSNIVHCGVNHFI